MSQSLSDLTEWKKNQLYIRFECDSCDTFFEFEQLILTIDVRSTLFDAFAIKFIVISIYNNIIKVYELWIYNSTVNNIMI